LIHGLQGGGIRGLGWAAKEHAGGRVHHHQVLVPCLGGQPDGVDVPAGERNGRGDDFTIGAVGAAFVDGADLIEAVGVAAGDQLVVFGDQALGGGEGAERVAVGEAVAVHG